MKRRMLSKRANKRNFKKSAGYVNSKNAANFVMRGGQRL